MTSTNNADGTPPQGLSTNGKLAIPNDNPKGKKTSTDPFAVQREGGAGPSSQNENEKSTGASPAHRREKSTGMSPAHRRENSDEWDASKTPPSRFQLPKGSVYATPPSRDGHIDKNADRDVKFHEFHDKKFGGGDRKSSSSKSGDAEK